MDSIQFDVGHRFSSIKPPILGTFPAWRCRTTPRWTPRRTSSRPSGTLLLYALIDYKANWTQNFQMFVKSTIPDNFDASQPLTTEYVPTVIIFPQNWIIFQLFQVYGMLESDLVWLQKELTSLLFRHQSHDSPHSLGPDVLFESEAKSTAWGSNQLGGCWRDGIEQLNNEFDGRRIKIMINWP